MNTDRMLTTGEAAARLGVSASFLNKLRGKGGGPAFAKIGSGVRYDPSDLDVWTAGQKHGSPAGAKQGAQP